MTRHAAENRRVSYRRRLLAAAAASLLLHLLFTRGLALSTLRLDAARLTDAERPRDRSERRRDDYALEVRKTEPRTPPAHERPLDLPLPLPTSEPPRSSTEPPRPREVAERRPEELLPAPTPSPPLPLHVTPSRPRDTALDPAATPTPSRDRPMPVVAAAPETTTAVAPPLTAAAQPTATEPIVAPAAAVPRQAEPAPLIASRWRPREVALLERLSASPPTAGPARPAAADPPAAAVSPSPGRQSVGPAAADAVAGVEPVAVPAAEPVAGPAAIVPRAATPRSTTGAAASTQRGVTDTEVPRMVAIPRVDALIVASNATGSRSMRGDAAAPPGAQATPVGRRTVADVADAAAAGPDGGVAAAPAPRLAATGAATGPAPAPQAGGRPQSSGTSAIGSGAATAVARAATDADAPLPGGPPSAGPVAVAIDGAGRSRDDAPAAGRGAPIVRSGITAPAPSAGGRADAITPPAVALAAEPGAVAAVPQALPRAGDRPPTAIGTIRPGIASLPAATEDEELSVPVPQFAAVVPADRRDATGPPLAAEGGPLERLVTAAALPTDGQVRDVAEAFARRAKTRPQPAPGTAAETADRVIDRGLEFLARSQQADGRWSLGRFAGGAAGDAPRLQSDTAATGLALLSFLGAGHDHYGGPHRDTVRRGLEYLLTVQKANGDLYVPADELSNSCAWLYSHGIAAIAVCEAVGMTGDPRLRPVAEKACGFITASQHSERGGWRYVPGTDADLSVSGWMLVALRSGDLAGVRTDPATLAGIRRLLEASATATNPSRYAYNPRSPQQRPSPLSMSCMTAVGALMRLHTGDTTAAPGVKEPCRVLAAMLPSYGSPSNRVRDAYLWYYASQVLVHDAGADWNRWYAALVATLAAKQETVGAKAGSWDPLGELPDRWGAYGGRIYVTALHLLALEVPYRHLPTYGRDPAAVQPPAR